MSYLVINCITDWSSDQDDLDSVGFDELFGQFQEDVEQHFAGLSPTGDVEKIYVQFQYDCARLPKTVSGTKIGRYSKKHKDIQAYIEVTRDEYQTVVDESGKLALMKDMLQRILHEIAGKLAGKVDHSVPELIERARSL